ncbi:hypothetical protein GCM10023194_81170 [Planotetraspora phitsanulokensis]|uniref:Uncharacterized protein n=1 Tax=Planotetraspora phitsanulokensis TaxID=575192 RepID=A0A8J3UCI4_9ACTN|nr:hypothetical protein [Planotetraspora phitsanulokensis]GII42958.1 hypothetical protein Pph01_79610 [Planotetraspora phitsanulokensis]
MSEFDRLIHLTGWVGETPDGSDAAYLLLTTNDPNAPKVMPLVAKSLGMNPRRGSVTMQPIGDSYVSVSTDLWAALHFGDDKFERPVDADWAMHAIGQNRVVVTVGYLPMPAGLDPWTYAEDAGAISQVVLGIFPARSAEVTP